MTPEALAAMKQQVEQIARRLVELGYVAKQKQETGSGVAAEARPK